MLSVFSRARDLVVNQAYAWLSKNGFIYQESSILIQLDSSYPPAKYVQVCHKIYQAGLKLEPLLHKYMYLLFSSVQLLSRVWLFATPWTTARQASLSITNSQSLLKLMSIESVIPSNHLILCRPLFLTPSIFPSIRVFSNKSVLYIRWPKYWSFNLNISPSNEYSGLISFRIDWFDLLAKTHFLSLSSHLSILDETWSEEWVAQTVKNPPAMLETWVQCLGREDPLEEGMATHSSVLA